MAPSASEPMSGESGSSRSQAGAGVQPTVESRPGERQVAALLAAIVAAVFIWWAWKQGAYFGEVFLPGAIFIYALLILLLLAAPVRARLRGPAAIATAAIVALAGWTLLSIIWSPVQDAALQDFERVILYAGAFLLGLWTCILAGRWMLLPLAAVAVVGAVIGVVVVVTLAGGTDVATIVHSDATLRFPIGYRNAEAAFLLICLWPTLALAAEGNLSWQLRALLVGVATMLLDLAFLSQSRGSLPAAAVAVTVFIAVSPRRLRAATYLGLAALPVLPVLPTLLDVFQHGHGGPGLIPLLRDAARAVAFSSIASIVLSAICFREVESRLDLGRKRVQILSRAAAAVAIAVVLIGGTIFVAQRGGPIGFLDQRINEFKQVGYPDLRSQGTRFGANVGSNRHDFWRVSVDQGRDHPLLGGGAGSFAPAYLLERKSGESPRDPHSVEMRILSELGVVGLLLFLTFVVSAALAGMRTRRLGPTAGALAAGSLTAGAYWLIHASYDWFWLYPAITAPAFFLLGACAAPSLRETSPEARSLRVGGAVAFAIAIVVAVPLFLSQRYANDAYDEFPADPSAAISDLDRASDLDPFDPAPLMTKGVIEARLGDEAAAAAAFREAIDRQPDGYAPHFFLARALASTDLATARAEAAEARRLNPLDAPTQELIQRLKRREALDSKNR
jgi:hypothetical protein